MGRFVKLTEGLTIYEFSGEYSYAQYNEDLNEYINANPQIAGTEEFRELLFSTQAIMVISHPSKGISGKTAANGRGAVVVGDQMKRKT